MFCPNCQKTYKDAEAEYEGKLAKEWQDNENDQWSDSDSDSSSGGGAKPSSFKQYTSKTFPTEYSRGLYKFYMNAANAYTNERTIWDTHKGVIGEHPNGTIRSIHAKYDGMSSVDKGKFTSPLKDAKNDAEIVDALVEMLTP